MPTKYQKKMQMFHTKITKTNSEKDGLHDSLANYLTKFSHSQGKISK